MKRRRRLRGRRRIRPRTVELAVFALLVGVSVVGLQELGARLEVRMEAARDASMRLLSRQLGREITYGSIAPSVLRAIEVRDLRIQSASGVGPPLLQVNRVRVGYSLIRLLATGDPVLAIREIRLVNSRFVVDLQQDTEFIALLQDLADLSGVRTTPLTFSGANIAVQLVSAETVVDVSRLFFRIRAGEQLATSARGDVVVTIPGAAGREPQVFETSVRMDGTTQPAIGRTDANVRLRYVRAPTFQLAGQTLRINQQGDELRLVKVQDRAPIDLSASIGLSSGELALQFQLDKFRPDRMVGVRGRWEGAAELLASTLSGEGALRHTIGTRSFDYELALQGTVMGLVYPPQIELLARASGNESSMDLAPLQVASEVGSLEFVGDVLYHNLFPNGLLTLTDVATQTGNELDALLRIGRGPEGLRIRGERVVLGVTGFREFELSLQPIRAPSAADTDRIRGFAYQVQASVAQLAENMLRASGKIELRPTLALTVTAELENLPAARIYQLAVRQDAREPWLNELARLVTVGGALHASTDFHSVEFQVDRLYAFETAQPTTYIELSAAGTETAFELDRVAGRWQGHTLSGSSSVELAAGGKAVRVVASLAVDDLPYAIEASFGADRVQVAGSYGREFTARRVAADDGFRFTVTSDQLPLSLLPEQAPLLATLDLFGQYRSPERWWLQSPGSRLQRLPGVLAADSEIAFALRADQDGATITRLAYSDALSSLAGSGSASYSTDLQQIEAALTLSGADSEERYAATLAWAGARIDGQVSFVLAPLERFATLPITGDVNGTVLIEGSMKLLAWTLDVDLVNGRLNSDPIRISGGADIFDRLISVRNFELQLLSHQIRNGRLLYDLESGGLNAQADYSAEIFGDPVEASMQLISSDADAAAGGFATALARGASAELLIHDIRVDDEALPAWSGRIVAPAEPTPTAFQFSGGPDNAFAVAVSRDGEFQLRTVQPYPIVGNASGSIAGRQINATVTFESIDATIANGIFDTETFTLTAGSATGSVRIFGAINDPDMSGNVTLTDARVVSPFTPAELGPYATVISLAEKRLQISELRPVGDAVTPLTLAAVATVEHWVPRDFVVELTTADAGVPVLYTFGPVLYDGLATGALTISGGDGEVDITGGVTAAFATVSLADQGKGGGGSSLGVDVVVSIGRRVEFAWPSEQFPILRALIAPDESVAVRYDGLNSTYTVVGDLSVRGGDLIYFDRSFILREGSISFREDELKFDPFLTVRAETRERDVNGEDVKILLSADTPLSEFSPQNVSFAADPPTHELAIETLLGAPLTADRNGNLGSMAISLSGDLLAQFGVIRPLEQTVREILGLDLVSIRSPFVQNLLLDRILSPVAGTTADLLDNTTLSLGKYIGSDLFLEALLRLQTPSRISSGLPGSSLESELELTLEWATPFFLLEWSFLPQSEETLYLTDNSLSLRWRLTY